MFVLLEADIVCSLIPEAYIVTLPIHEHYLQGTIISSSHFHIASYLSSRMGERTWMTWERFHYFKYSIIKFVFGFDAFNLDDVLLVKNILYEKIWFTVCHLKKWSNCCLTSRRSLKNILFFFFFFQELLCHNILL